MTTVLFDPAAKEEFLESIKFYENCRSGLGKHFSKSVEKAIQQIVEAPFRYRILISPFRRYLLLNFPFVVIYSIEPDHIRIIAIAHTKKNQAIGFQDLSYPSYKSGKQRQTMWKQGVNKGSSLLLALSRSACAGKKTPAHPTIPRLHLTRYPRSPKHLVAS
ncbi:type II toxin-antitoxin system RelE/ParE family toxin [Desulfobulbus alkaliphilus]|uniref:type II toxin-antitoxin system RelE/ParE family toxin n=1 Tax=Desulfobulbus alkaliphilus TaxID=869814 RepID=UPI001963A399|nr:type II toxin-antitoxin system RelE/ParE family toxin [Desulfobulbus alkaliphilus]MBM9538533.1 type II toxin-antitoxin system RelE/ParE family toxin [Desulfobulbus alkaliphilus]